MKSDYKLFHGNDFEDRYLVANFKLPDFGVFVDIGAGPDGIQGSNSYHFEKNGWMCLCADADPRNWESLRKNRKLVYCGLVSNRRGKQRLHLGNDSNDVTGMMRTEDNGKLYVMMEPIKLKDLLKRYHVDHVDILSIDTEGTEFDVWKSIGKIRPTLLIVEAITQGQFNILIEPQICEYGYRVVAENGANLIFVKK